MTSKNYVGVPETFQKHPRSKDDEFLHRNCIQENFSTPKKIIFSMSKKNQKLFLENSSTNQKFQCKSYMIFIENLGEGVRGSTIVMCLHVTGSGQLCPQNGKCMNLRLLFGDFFKGSPGFHIFSFFFYTIKKNLQNLTFLHEFLTDFDNFWTGITGKISRS